MRGPTDCLQSTHDRSSDARPTDRCQRRRTVSSLPPACSAAQQCAARSTDCRAHTTDHTHTRPTDSTGAQPSTGHDPTDRTHARTTDCTHARMTDCTHARMTDCTHAHTTDCTHARPTSSTDVVWPRARPDRPPADRRDVRRGDSGWVASHALVVSPVAALQPPVSRRQ